MRELAEYHNIPLKRVEDIREDTDIRNIYESVDFSQILDGHIERYNRFTKFLNKNGITNVTMKHGRSLDFQKRMKDITLNCPEGVAPYRTLPVEQQKAQLRDYLRMCEGKN